MKHHMIRVQLPVYRKLNREKTALNCTWTAFLQYLFAAYTNHHLKHARNLVWKTQKLRTHPVDGANQKPTPQEATP